MCYYYSDYSYHFKEKHPFKNLASSFFPSCTLASALCSSICIALFCSPRFFVSSASPSQEKCEYWHTKQIPTNYNEAAVGCVCGVCSFSHLNELISRVAKISSLICPWFLLEYREKGPSWSKTNWQADLSLTGWKDVFQIAKVKTNKSDVVSPSPMKHFWSGAADFSAPGWGVCPKAAFEGCAARMARDTAWASAVSGGCRAAATESSAGRTGQRRVRNQTLWGLMVLRKHNTYELIFLSTHTWFINYLRPHYNPFIRKREIHDYILNFGFCFS